MRKAKCTAAELHEFFDARPAATNKDAALHFGVSDRRIRQIREESSIAPVAVAEPPRRARIVERPDARYASVLFRPDELINVDMTKCPKCGEMQRPLPGDTRGLWARVGCGDCRNRLHQPVASSVDVYAEISTTPEPEPETSAEGKNGSNALQSQTSVSFLPHDAAPAAEISAPGNYQIAGHRLEARPRVIVRTIYVRPGLFDVVPFHVALAIVVATVLIALCMWQVS